MLNDLRLSKMVETRMAAHARQFTYELFLAAGLPTHARRNLEAHPQPADYLGRL